MKNQLEELAVKAALQKEAVTGAETNLRLVQERLDGVTGQRREAFNLIGEKKRKIGLGFKPFLRKCLRLWSCFPDVTNRSDQ